MRKGAPLLGNRDYYCKQSNNAFEEYRRTSGDRLWLVSCGPESLANATGALGIQPVVKLGSFEFQRGDLHMLYFNDYRNFEKFKMIRDYTNGSLAHTPKNEIPQYYPLAVKELYGIEGEFCFGLCFDAIKTRVLTGDQTVQACLKHPAHYISFCGYDDEKDCLIYDDTYPERFADRNGFNRDMSRVEFLSNVDNYFNTFTRPPQ